MTSFARLLGAWSMASRKKAGVNWTHDSLTPTLAQFTLKANVAIIAEARFLAQDIEQWMKDHAPWEDRTGLARQELFAAVKPEGFRVTIYFGHGLDVPYGIYLEVRWGGFYSIIIPTLEHYNGKVFWENFDGMIGAATKQTGGRTVLM